jgi:hypothetical protein
VFGQPAFRGTTGANTQQSVYGEIESRGGVANNLYPAGTRELKRMFGVKGQILRGTCQGDMDDLVRAQLTCSLLQVHGGDQAVAAVVSWAAGYPNGAGMRCQCRGQP